MKIPMIKHDGALRPMSNAAAAVLGKIKQGAEVMVEVTRPRNIRHHRLFFALVQIIFNNQDRYESEEHLLTALKVALGHCETIVLQSGAPAYIPKSIAFAKMDQVAFDGFFENACQVAIKHWLPTVTSEQLRDEVLEMVR